jgi:hypothetical protein
MPTWAWVLNLGINMNIELDEVVVLDVSDEALELAAGGAQGGRAIAVSWACRLPVLESKPNGVYKVLAIADR